MRRVDCGAKTRGRVVVCAVVGCERKPIARGLCENCYARWRKCLPPKPSEPRGAKKARLRAEVTRRREAGASTSDIGAAVGVSASTVRQWLNDWGVTLGSGVRPENLWQPWAADDIEFAVSRTDLSLAERASVLGRSVDSVFECVRKHEVSRSEESVE